jgi:hypothetical protein
MPQETLVLPDRSPDRQYLRDLFVPGIRAVRLDRPDRTPRLGRDAAQLVDNNIAIML